MNHYGKHGIAFKKDFLVKQGVRPITYIPYEARVQRNQNTALEDKGQFKGCSIEEYFLSRSNELRDAPASLGKTGANKNQIAKLTNIFNAHILGYMKFFDHTLEEKHNYYLAREWAVVGNVCFKLEDIDYLIVPD